VMRLSVRTIGTSCRRAAHSARIANCVFELSVLPWNMTLGFGKSAVGNIHGSCKSGSDWKCAGMEIFFDLFGVGRVTSMLGGSSILMQPTAGRLHCETGGGCSSGSAGTASLPGINPMPEPPDDSLPAPGSGLGFSPDEPCGREFGLDELLPARGLANSAPAFCSGLSPGSLPFGSGFGFCCA